MSSSTVPASHAPQVAEPAAAYVPASHAMHSAAPVAAAVPAVHCMHVSAPAPEYSPASQSSQPAPSSVTALPAVHSRHVTPFTGYWPGSQWTHTVLASVSRSALPAAHGVQAAAPAAAYVPALHASHSAMPGAEVCDPGAHSWHVVAFSAANVPAGHCVQPVAGLLSASALPALQTMHASPSPMLSHVPNSHTGAGGISVHSVLGSSSASS